MNPIIQKLWMFIAMLCASLSASAYDFEVDGVAYTITSVTDLTVTVDGLVNKELAVVNIPEEVQYKNRSLKVVSIGNWALNYKSLCEVNLPNTIETIGDYAFYRASNLKKINIPNLSSLQSIGESAFEGTGLQKIELPPCIKSLGDYTFKNSEIESVSLPEMIEEIPYGCFYECKKLQNVEFSSSVIEARAFYNCISLRHITLPANLTRIVDRAFSGCENLEEFILPSNVTIIGPSIIEGCNKISKLTIGKSLESLPVSGRVDYSNSTGMYTYKWFSLGAYCQYDRPSNNVSYCPNNKIDFFLKGVKQFIIEDSYTPLNIRLFITDHEKGIPPFSNLELDYYYVGRPLSEVEGFKSDYLNFSVDRLGGAISGRIKKLEISGGCKSVPNFYQKVENLVLGENVTSLIGSNVANRDLKTIVCKSTTPPILGKETYQFEESDEAFPPYIYTEVTLYVPSGCKEIYSNAVGWRNFWDIQEMNESSVIDQISDNNATNIVNVYSIQGNLVKSGVTLYELQDLPKGVYIVVSPKCTKKIKL